MKIDILDTTLRDGGYINNWQFNDEHIMSIINSLVESNCEIIECGYLKDQEYINNSTIFNSVKSIDKVLKKINIVKKDFKIYAMINFGDFDVFNMPKREAINYLDGIRLAFHKKDYKNIKEVANKILLLGYDLCIQPMVTKDYSKKELEELIDISNGLNVSAFYIVDSFGNMSIEILKDLYKIIDNKLLNSIQIGLHLHNNLQLAFSNAQYFIKLANKRNIIIDSSVSGIGRGAGNLNTEIIFNSLNEKYNKNYNLLPILEIIDDYLEVMRKEYGWGYSIAYYLSAIRGCHPNYASFFVNKKNLTVKSIKQILDNIDNNMLVSFDVEYAQKLFNNHLYENAIKQNEELSFLINREILLVASGMSVLKYKEKIEQFIKESNPLVIGLNHIPSTKVDYCFFSNEKRFKEFYDENNSLKYLVTSNILTSKLKNTKIISLKEVYSGNSNVAILAINLLINEKKDKVYIAGLDGYKQNILSNYAYKEYGEITDKNLLLEKNELIKEGLKSLVDRIKIIFLSPSIFEKKEAI